MAKKSEKTEGKQEQQHQQQRRFYARPDLEYVYRDTFNVYVGFEEVILEFGNRHRSSENEVTIGDRLVLSIANAQRLQQALQRGLDELRQQLEKQQGAAAETAKDQLE
jgi:hypothetical protein